MFIVGVLFLFLDEWESDENDDEGEWMDVYYLLDEEEEV